MAVNEKSGESLDPNTDKVNESENSAEIPEIFLTKKNSKNEIAIQLNTIERRSPLPKD